jgi:hypothetical protein
MNYDQYKEGLFDPYSPINEKEMESEKSRVFENLSDAKSEERADAIGQLIKEATQI